MFQSVICSVFKEENLFINEKYNTYKEVGSVFFVSFSVPFVRSLITRKELSWGPFCGLHSDCFRCSLTSPTRISLSPNALPDPNLTQVQ